MNVVTLTGRITKDLELKHYNDKAFVAFTLAVDSYRKEEKADFISIKVWNKQAENLAAYCKKGSKISVVGRLETGSYDKDGRKIYTTDVIANQIEFLSHPINQNSSEEIQNNRVDTSSNRKKESSKYFLEDEPLDPFENPFEVKNEGDFPF